MYDWLAGMEVNTKVRPEDEPKNYLFYSASKY